MTVSRGKILILLAGTALLAVSVPLFAHHGTAAFDTDQMVTVKGTITDFQYVNPHAQVYFTVKNDKGEPLGGARLHTATSGVAHYMASDDADCIARIRERFRLMPSPPSRPC